MSLKKNAQMKMLEVSSRVVFTIPFSFSKEVVATQIFKQVF